MHSDNGEHFVEVPVLQPVRDLVDRGSSVLGLAEVPGKVVVNLSEVVGVLRLRALAPVIEVHH